MTASFSVPQSTIVVTGGAGGIGRALAERFLREGAARVVVADTDPERVASVAAGLGPRVQPLTLDVTDEAAVADAIAHVEDAGPIDLWCSNAGVAAGSGLGDAADWERSWRVHVLAVVHAARVLFPRMAARGRGHLLVTASAAGLLTQLDSAPYSATKHGAVALAEWLAIRHAGDGIGVCCLCPMGVNTAMTADDDTDSATRIGGDYIEPAQVADSVVDGLGDGRFLILPHPQVAGYELSRARDRDGWLAGMGRAWARLRARGAAR